MPELPEVEVVRAGLEPAVTGARIAEVRVLEPRSLRRHPGPSEDFVARLSGRHLTGAVRRGKFLWFPIAVPVPPVIPAADADAQPAPEEALVAHLGMSGQMLLRAPDAPAERLTRAQLLLEHPAHGPLRLDFVDQRIFGSLAIDDLLVTRDGLPAGFAGAAPSAPGDDRIPTAVAHIARDPLDPSLDEAAALAALRRGSSAIKRVLLDQERLSGIGNIYADESLWAARLHPEQPASTVSARKARELLEAVRSVLRKALAEGGTSFDAQYVNVNGQSGYFSHSLNAYGQHGKACPRCGGAIIREQFMNRSSHYCPRCQKLR
ncbi:MAG: bifunctional DNA-formamidopyrimidine glycosylase/DNA-(apurinic or apyrimidinic site) lyase [Microbacteriaceae bacterium]